MNSDCQWDEEDHRRTDKNYYCDFCDRYTPDGTGICSRCVRPYDHDELEAGDAISELLGERERDADEQLRQEGERLP